MGAQELRERLIKKIEQADEKMLVVYSNALEIAEDESGDWFSSLPKSLKQRLDASIKQAENGEVIPHEQVMREARAKYGLKK